MGLAPEYRLRLVLGLPLDAGTIFAEWGSVIENFILSLKISVEMTPAISQLHDEGEFTHGGHKSCNS